MDPRKCLVWQYSDKKEKWYDATDQVTWISRDPNCFAVHYRGSGTLYHVSYTKMEYCEEPERIPFERLFRKDEPLYYVKEAIRFCDKAKLFYENGHTEVVLFSDLVARVGDFGGLPRPNVFSYFYHAAIFSAESEDDRYLAGQFKDIGTVPKDSVLDSYLRGAVGENKSPIRGPILTPFPSNASQITAMEEAFRSQISIIEGPPGTGKTQTILNLLVNALSNGYRTAVVSNNNSATDNVYEKLDSLGYSFLCARLGNKDNIGRFFDSIDMSIPSLREDKSATSSELVSSKNYLRIAYEKSNRRCKLLEEKDGLELEYEHFKSAHGNIELPKKTFLSNIPSSVLLRELTYLGERFGKTSRLRQVLRRLRLGGIFSVFSKSLAYENPQCLEALYYRTRLKEIEKEIGEIDAYLTKGFQQTQRRVQEISTSLFNHSLQQRFSTGRGGKSPYDAENYVRDFDAFTRDFPILLSSTYSLANCSKTGFLFDYVIVDESSQVNLASGILSMLMAKNIVIVGDTKQLPQIDDASFKEKDAYLMKKYEIEPDLDYLGNSLMTSVIRRYGDKVKTTLLREHYRCDPAIIGFCNEEFYDGQLIIASRRDKAVKPMRLVILPEGNHARSSPEEGGLYSQREADEIASLIREDRQSDIGVIAPYRAQVRTIQERLDDDSIDVSTVHKFQGREKRNIILSTVVNSPNDFVDDPNLINVAVSRAKETFTMVASSGVAHGKSGVLSDLAGYIRYHNDIGETRQGQVHSVFDLLYKAYEDKLLEFNRTHPSKGFASENLVRALLEEILKQKRFQNLRFSMHVSLRNLIKCDGLALSKEEEFFYKNPWSHADFVIYSRMDREPVLVIEVDGVSYHEKKKDQLRRDALKDAILAKAEMQILRLKTNGSEEKNRIESTLSKLIFM